MRYLKALQSNKVTFGETERRGLGQVRLGDAGDEVAIHALRDHLRCAHTRIEVCNTRQESKHVNAKPTYGEFGDKHGKEGSV